MERGRPLLASPMLPESIRGGKDGLLGREKVCHIRKATLADVRAQMLLVPAAPQSREPAVVHRAAVNATLKMDPEDTLMQIA